MAKKSLIQKNLSRIFLTNKLRYERCELRRRRNDKLLPLDQRFEIQKVLSSLPRNSARVRIRNRCMITGRSRGVYSKFMLSRICIRIMAAKGQLPGVRKSSW